MKIKRNVDTMIENFIDKKIAPKLLVPTKDTNPQLLHLMALEALVGIVEHGGNNSGKLVESIQRTIGTNDREPWCMSLQQCAIAYVEKKTSKLCSVPTTEHCLTALRDADKLNLAVTDPMIGDLMIYQHGDTNKGHVACIVEDGDEFVRTIEGNTGPDRVVTRDGDGVYHKLRSLKGSGNMRVAGFIRVIFGTTE